MRDDRLDCTLPIAQLDPGLALPSYARPGDAGLDLVARTDVSLPAAGGRAVVTTGIAVAIPEGFAGLVLPRSGLAARHGVTVVNAPGLIDAGYRGEVMVPLVNTDPTEPFDVRRGDRIAQLVVVPVAYVTLEPVEPLPASLGGDDARGTGGFGHSGR